MPTSRRILAVLAVGLLAGVIARPWSGPSSTARAQQMSPSKAFNDALLVVSSKEHAVIMMDPRTGNRTAFFRVGLNPKSVCVSPDGHTAVVTNTGDRIGGNSICVIDLYASNLVRTIELVSSRKRPDQSVVTHAYHRPTGVTFVPGQPRVIVSCASEGALLLIDLEEGRVIGDVLLGQDGAAEVIVDHSGRFAYVANRTSGTVSVVKLDRMRVDGTIEAGGGPAGMALHPTANEIWLTNSETNSISIIDCDEREERLEFACGAMPIDVAFTPDGRYALVANLQEGNVSVIETDTRRIRTLLNIDRVTHAQAKARPVPYTGHFGRSPLPTSIVVDPEGERAWISTSRNDQVHDVSLRSWRVLRSVDAITEPAALAWSRKTDTPVRVPGR